jgi:hypothetical protein
MSERIYRSPQKEDKPMEDRQIVDLYWQRDETAIAETFSHQLQKEDIWL